MVAWLLPAAMVASAAIAGGASYMGAQEANSANRALSMGQMDWQGDQARLGEWFQREMWNKSAEYNAQRQELGLNWSERMSNSAYQRATADMRAAGINPILAYNQGGAATPGASSASAPGYGSPSAGSVSPAKMENTLGPAVSSAMQAANVMGGLHQTAANIGQTEANTRLIQENVMTAQETQSNLRASTAKMAAETATEGERTGLVRNETARAAMEPALRQAQTAAQNAAAGEAAERTRGLTETNRDYRNYGPPSTARDAAVSGERIGQRLRDSGATDSMRGAVGRTLDGLGGAIPRNTYSGPRSLPTAPGARGSTYDPNSINVYP